MPASGHWAWLAILLIVTGCQAPAAGTAVIDGAGQRQLGSALVTPEPPALSPRIFLRQRGAVPPPPPRIVRRAPRTIPPAAVQPAAPRVIAIGDVHGDLAATRRVLRFSDVIDKDDHWIGGDLVVVQVGDQLDRGDDEREILDLFERLAEEAHAAGGAFYSLLGNHETMNVSLDFRYVTDAGWKDFADIPHNASDPSLLGFGPERRGRVAAFRPGGRYARVLAQHNVVMQIGDTVFVHGGLAPSHLALGLDGINRATQAWLRGDAQKPDFIDDSEGPVWTRRFSSWTDSAACLELTQTLSRLGARRMVVGHTPQHGGVTSACDGRVWRVDVGLSGHYGGEPAAVELARGQVKILRDGQPPFKAADSSRRHRHVH